MELKASISAKGLPCVKGKLSLGEAKQATQDRTVNRSCWDWNQSFQSPSFSLSCAIDSLGKVCWDRDPGKLASQPALPPPVSDSRAGKLPGTHVPELTARGPLKIALSGAVQSCLAPQRGEGRAWRLSWEGDKSLHPGPRYCPCAGAPGLGGGGTGLALCRQQVARWWQSRAGSQETSLLAWSAWAAT